MDILLERPPWFPLGPLLGLIVVAVFATLNERLGVLGGYSEFGRTGSFGEPLRKSPRGEATGKAKANGRERTFSSGTIAASAGDGQGRFPENVIASRPR